MKQNSSPATVPDSKLRAEEAAQLRRLEVCSALEATTLVVLVAVAAPLKHVAGWPQGVRILGPIHGLAVAFYCWTVVQTVAGGGWRRADVVRLFAVAFVPFAGFLNIAWIRRRAALLEGQGPCR